MLRLSAMSLLFALGACAIAPEPLPDPAAPATAPPWGGMHGQMVVVTVHGWDAATGTLARFERSNGGWRSIGDTAMVSIGRAGAAWGEGLHPPQDGPQKREGDGRSPAGVFQIGPAFGYAPGHDTALTYLPMQASHWCIDVPASPLYNRIVDASEAGADAVAGSTEPMRLDLHADGDQRYRLGFVIRHNDDARAGGGSCIFAHLWGTPGQATAGCTAMHDATMQELLAWLDPALEPLFVLLPADEYARLAPRWQLPDLHRKAR
jgi:L,D-peptidoglycan transpeptidase YkuD (ErfK/YbiS/YcfS/YnhG family)